MGLTKTTVFSDKENKLAGIAKALGHPARIAIIRVLLKKQDCICGELVHELPLSQATISQHLKVLKEAGLIRGEVEGRRSCYCINGKVWNEAQKILDEFFDTYVPEGACC